MGIDNLLTELRAVTCDHIGQESLLGLCVRLCVVGNVLLWPFSPPKRDTGGLFLWRTLTNLNKIPRTARSRGYDQKCLCLFIRKKLRAHNSRSYGQILTGFGQLLLKTGWRQWFHVVQRVQEETYDAINNILGIALFSWAQKQCISELDAKHALLVVTGLVFPVVREWLWGLNGDMGNGHPCLFLNEASASPIIKPCRRFGLNKEILLYMHLLTPPVPSSKRHLRYLQQSWSPWILLWSVERNKNTLGRIWSMNTQNRSEKLYLSNACSFPLNKKKSLGWVAPA